jgi:hypothetical protein
MCHIQETTYLCGYVQNTLLLACPFAARLYRIAADDDAPIFCLHGLIVNRSINIEETYGSNPTCNYDSLQMKVLKPLFRRQVVLQDEFADYAARIRAIKACLQSSNRPTYNFYQTMKEGWDAEELQKRQDELWDHVLPASVERTTDVFASASDEMTIAYSLTLNHPLKSHDGITRSSSHLPALKTQLDSGSSLSDIDMEVYEQILQQEIEAVQHELHLLEVHALDACMDDIGWVLPSDKNAKNKSLRVMENRLVQPEEKSGTSIREWLIRKR